MKKNVLYISYDGMTDPLGQSQVLPYLSELSKKGYVFHLISFEKEEKFSKFSSTIQKICDASNIIWHPLTYTKKPPLLATIYDVWRMNKLAKKIVVESNIVLVHCRSYISALVGMQLKASMNIKFVFDMRGFWADERVEGNIWNLSNPIFKIVYHFFKKKELAYFSNADHTISLTYCGKNEIHSWKKIENSPIPIQVIPCCVDIEKFTHPKGIADTQIFQKLKKEGVFILGYIGSIGTWYMLDEMLDFFIEFKKKKSNAIFLFITQEQDLVKQKCIEKGIPLNNIYLSSCLHAEVPDYIDVFDASVFFIKPSFSKKASSPTKQGEIMALGKPIFCNAGVGDTDMVIEKYKAGEIIYNFDVKDYEKAINKFLETNYNSETIVQGAKEFYSLTEGANRYEAVYKELLK